MDLGASESGEATGWVGRIAFVLALVLTGFLERTQFRLRFLEYRTWWASNGRDVLNALAFLALFGPALMMGFDGPMALVIAATVLVLSNALQSAMGLRPGATLLSVGLALALGLPVAIAPGLVRRLLRAGFDALF